MMRQSFPISTRKITECFQYGIMTRIYRHFYRFPLFWGIIAAAAATMAIITPFDYAIVFELSAYDYKPLSSFMNESIFEGDRFGAGDISTFFQIAALFLYVYAWLNSQRRSRIVQCRPYFGFVVTTSLVLNVFIVHGLKFALGRARPEMVIENQAAFSNWYEFGALFLPLETSVGSLPSGHTASAIIFMTIAYALAGDRYHPTGIRLFGWIIAGLSLAYALFMTAIRCISLYHWPTDCLFSIIFGCLVIHILYFWILQVPRQTGYIRRIRSLPPGPKFWELKLCWHIFLAALGVLAMLTGVRGMFIENFAVFGIILIGGIIIFTGAIRSASTREIYSRA